MSALSKIVKIIAIAMMLLGLLSIGMGIYMFVAGANVEVDGAVAGQAVANAGGIIMCVFGLFYLISGFIGARGANNPSKLTPFIVICFIIAALNALETGLSISGNGFEPTVAYNIIYVVVALVGAICAIRAKKDAADRLL